MQDSDGYGIKVQNNFDIKDIISNKKITVCFQTIVSLSRKKVVGVEGLIRGIDENNQHILPVDLFNAAEKQGKTLELDRICREKVLQAFSYIYKDNKSKLLFLNLDASVLDQVGGSNYLINQVQNFKINPRNIVIEINESKVLDSDALKKFCDAYRKLGFMVALDDVGTGFSNMDRISIVKPDIIKTDISLIKNIQYDYYKQGTIKSLISLSNTIGALIIAEGVETEQEAIQILKLGGQMMQGYFFSSPLENSDDFFGQSYNKIDTISNSFNKYMRSKLRDENKKNKNLYNIVNKCIEELICVPSSEFDNKLLHITLTYNNIECAYILDKNGIQVSNTIRFCNEDEVKDNLMFYSARVGTDHTMDKYYYPLISANLRKYITEPYVSLATGNLCITISKVFKNIDNKKYILCIDFNTTDHAFDLDTIKEFNVSNLVFNINGKSITEINRIINRMNEEIIKDSLTNTYNRRYMEERLMVDVFNASNANQPISVIMADIDFFKKVNDTYGHQAGDFVLKEFVKIAKKNIRVSSDWIARYGGEEFVIVLLNSDQETAFKISEDVRNAVEKAIIQYNEQSIQITVSLGIGTQNENKMMYEQLIKMADKNLYLAKNSGRNKTVCNLN